MAGDQLATVADLASMLQTTVDATFTTVATLLIECGTAVVQQAAGGQRIVQVTGDTTTLLGTTDSWLDLPQIPVTTVTSVTLDGILLTVGTDYKVFGNRLFRAAGWQANQGWPMDWPWSRDAVPPSVGSSWLQVQQPSTVVVVNTHGYASGAQELQLGRSSVLGLVRGVYANPGGATSEKIDDYAVAFEAMSARMEASPYLKAALRKQYGRRAALVRIG